MQAKMIQGQFDVIDSFAIRRRNEFYLIGHLKEGVVQENWFINIPLNSSLAITVRITSIEDVEVAGEKNNYKLIIVTGENETLDLLIGLKIGSELLDITIQGED